MYTLIIVVTVLSMGGSDRSIASTSQSIPFTFSTKNKCEDAGKQAQKDLTPKIKKNQETHSDFYYTETMVTFSCLQG